MGPANSIAEAQPFLNHIESAISNLLVKVLGFALLIFPQLEIALPASVFLVSVNDFTKVYKRSYGGSSNTPV